MKNAEWILKEGYRFQDLRADMASGNGHEWRISLITRMRWNRKVEFDEPVQTAKQAVGKWLDMEHKERLLDKTEKRYLENLIRPFREKVRGIKKAVVETGDWNSMACITIKYDDAYVCKAEFSLPVFIDDYSMYTGMSDNVTYTPEELGLFAD